MTTDGPSGTSPTTGATPGTGATPSTGATPATGSHRVIVDPSRRADVLFRVRREEDHEVSAWWLIGAFVAVSVAVIALLSFVPGGA